MVPLSSPIRPRQQAENALVEGILDGSLPPGSSLPGERLLASQLGVTRPTLREALQRLARDGWLTVAHGKPTIVNNYWEEGGLNVLGKLAERSELPPNFVSQLLEIRLLLAPAYTRGAVLRAPQTIAELLTIGVPVVDSAELFATFDWQLHRLLTLRSGNPINTLILNGFKDIYADVGVRYFASAEARDLSRQFYAALRSAANDRDAELAGQICRDVMLQSITLWETRAVESAADRRQTT